MPEINIVIPDEVGDVEECVVVTWLKKAGDVVKAGDEILILQAEKVSFEVPAPAGGTLNAILAKQGEVVKRGQPLALLEVAEGAAPPPAPRPEPQPAAAPPQPARELRASPVAKRLARENGINLADVPPADGNRITEKDVLAFIEARQPAAAAPAPPETPPEPAREVRASPAAKRLAREHGLDLAQIPAGGGSDRITERDVEAYLAARQPPAAPPPAAVETVPLAGMRAAIAQRMHQSLQEMAQLTLHTEADVTELVARREALKQQHGVTYTDLIVRACALALKAHPRLNARLAGNSIELLPEVHIGLAVALAEGLVVPVIRQADALSPAELARERTRLSERARAGQLTADEMSGGTFTLTNLGMYDIDAFTPIVNPPEAAILGVGRIVEKVVIREGKVAQRSMLTLSLSFDHRLVDGAPAAAFLQAVKQALEKPDTL
ncbi:MAG: hypothetical protein Kow0031_29110 [Anaerolineae bacterium]